MSSSALRRGQSAAPVHEAQQIRAGKLLPFTPGELNDISEAPSQDAPWERLAALHRALADTYDAFAATAQNSPARRAESNSLPSARLLTASQAAEFVGCHPRTLRRLELQGLIPPPIGAGKLKRWRRADLDRWTGGRP